MYLTGLGASTALQRTLSREGWEQEARLLAIQQAGEERTTTLTLGLIGLAAIAAGTVIFMLFRRKRS